MGNGFAKIKTYHRSTNQVVDFEPSTDLFAYDGNTWNTLAVSIDNENGIYILYNNGLKLLDYNFSPSSFFHDFEWQIGDISYSGIGGYNYFNGNIDNLSIWNKALDSVEISDYTLCA